MPEEDEEDFEFECIPLKSVIAGGGPGDWTLISSNEEAEEDIYFLDEFGNYVFPVTSPAEALAGSGSGPGGGGLAAGGGCSCPPSADEINIASALRRQSQASVSESKSVFISRPQKAGC